MSVWLELQHSSGRPGDHLFVDDVIAGDRASASEESAAPPAVSTPPSHAPLAPPEQVCDSAALDGPTTQPAGSVRIDPGEDLADATAANPPSTTFWLSPGIHKLDGTSEWSQVIPKDGNSYIGARGAVLDGRQVNRYAFTQRATNVAIKHLTIQNFVAPGQRGSRQPKRR